MIAPQAAGQHEYQFSEFPGDEGDEFELLSSYLLNDGDSMNQPVGQTGKDVAKPRNYDKKKLSKVFAVVEQNKSKRAKTVKGNGRSSGFASVEKVFDVGDDEDDEDGDDENDDDDDDDGDEFDDDDDLDDAKMEDGGGDDGDKDEFGRAGKKHSRKRLRERQDQVARRRERNRVLARKTRLRKKFFFESLQQQSAQLSAENEMLRSVLKSRLESESSQHATLTAAIPSLLADEAKVQVQPTAILERSDFSLVAAIQTAQRSFLITDPSLPDNPIIFASRGFLELSGYPLDQVLGRNCRFMQTAGTDPVQLKILKDGIEKGVDTSVCLLNARADGTLFYNHIFVAPLRDVNNVIVNYVGVQMEVTAPIENNDEEANKNLHSLACKILSKNRARKKPTKKDAYATMAAAEGRTGRLARRNTVQDEAFAATVPAGPSVVARQEA